MARRDRKCICCQSKYKYCPTCSDDKMKPTWMTEFCGETCKELWTTATKYNMNMLTKPEAKAAIEALELKERSAYVECVQRDLENILAEEPVAVIEEPIVVEETAPILEEKPFSKKKQKSHEVVKKEYK